MTTYGELEIWSEQFPVGEGQPFSVDYHGLRYRGEVIRVDRWTPDLGEPLDGDAFFRIVLLVRRPRVISPDLRDQALCIPATGLSRQRGQLTDEIATIRETQAVYLTQRDADTELIRRSLQRRQEGLEEQLLDDESARYAAGTIVAGSEQFAAPGDFFEGRDPTAWFSRIAHWLLSHAYPELPVDESLLPRTVTDADARELHRAIFNQRGSSSSVLAALGPALGLSTVGNPGTFQANASGVFDLIQSKLAPSQGAISWPDVHHYLSHQVGLTGSLATMYLLLYLHYESPELALGLSSGHGLQLLDSQPLLGDRLTADLIPLLQWPGSLIGLATDIGPETSPQWNDALNYLTIVSPGLTAVEGGQDYRAQEQQLMGDARRMVDTVARCRQTLAVMSARGPGGIALTGEISESMSRLSQTVGGDFAEVYRAIRSVFPNYVLFREDVSRLEKLNQLTNSLEALQSAWDYLDGVAIPEHLGELFIELQGLLAALSPGALLRFSRSWDAVAYQVSSFKSRYAAAYLAHHRSFHQELGNYLLDRNAAQRRVRALGLLNTISELGEPAGIGLDEALDSMGGMASPCPMAVEGLDLADSPICPSCNLSLEQSLDAAALTRLLAAIDAALGDKNRTLSNLVVDRILHGQVDEQIEEFLKIVQASDLSALSNTISEELVAFLQRMLA